jgi:hypothetical protein
MRMQRLFINDIKLNQFLVGTSEVFHVWIESVDHAFELISGMFDWVEIGRVWRPVNGWNSHFPQSIVDNMCRMSRSVVLYEYPTVNSNLRYIILENIRT